MDPTTDRLRWGILSTADIALRKVIPGLRRSPRSEVVAIASREAGRATAAAQQLGIPRAHASYEALLADPDIDAVYIPLPNHRHAEWTIASARAGKHVLCEKPLALTATQAQEMVDACREAGVLLMEAFMYRHHPSWIAARELVASGRIGRLQAVDSWFSYFNDDPRNIRNVVDVGGGALYDIGCYSVNLSRMLFAAEPTRVQAAVRRDPVVRVDIYGTDGRISIEIPFNIPPDRPTRIFLTAGGDPPVAPASETIEFDIADPYACEADRFADAVLDGTPLPVEPADAVANLGVIEAIFAAGG